MYSSKVYALNEWSRWRIARIRSTHARTHVKKYLHCNNIIHVMCVCESFCYFFSRQVWIIYIAPPTRAIIIARTEPHAGSSLERAKQPRREKNKIKTVATTPFGRQKYIFCVVIIIIIEQLRFANARDLFHTIYIVFVYVYNIYIRYFYYYYYYYHHSRVSTLFFSFVCTTRLHHRLNAVCQLIFFTRFPLIKENIHRTKMKL